LSSVFLPCLLPPSLFFFFFPFRPCCTPCAECQGCLVCICGSTPSYEERPHAPCLYHWGDQLPDDKCRCQVQVQLPSADVRCRAVHSACSRGAICPPPPRSPQSSRFSSLGEATNQQLWLARKRVGRRARRCSYTLPRLAFFEMQRLLNGSSRAMPGLGVPSTLVPF
jgi:hypothetical protein